MNVRNEEATDKQKKAIYRIRERVGDDALLNFVRRGKWKNYDFNLDHLTKNEAQHIITSAPHKPIFGVYGRDINTQIKTSPKEINFSNNSLEEDDFEM